MNPINWIVSANLTIITIITVSTILFNSTVSERVTNGNKFTGNLNWSW